jgi:hypothetical protein
LPNGMAGSISKQRKDKKHHPWSYYRSIFVDMAHF